MCLYWLKRHKIDVAFIQESYFKHPDKQRLSNRYYYTSAVATFNSKSRGALVVLRHSLSLTITGHYESEVGRIAYITTNVYSQRIWSQHIPPSTTAFQGLVSDFSLTDLYRAINPTSRQYILYSYRHKIYSRIDHLLDSATLY